MVVLIIHRFDDQTLTILTALDFNIKGAIHLKSPVKYINIVCMKLYVFIDR